MQLSLSTWPEIESYLERRRDVLVPIGSTEQHGPSGLLGTDAICPEGICAALGDRDGVLVAPVLPIGNAQHHLGFPGTLSLRPITLVNVLVDVIDALVHHGFERIVFVNGHGGNIAPVHTAFAEVHARVTLDGRRPIGLELVNWWEGPRVDALLRELYGDDDGQHGTCGEISLAQHLRPDHVKVPPTPGRAPSFTGIADATDYRRRYPDGRIGSDPSRSRPEHGARILAAAVDDLAER